MKMKKQRIGTSSWVLWGLLLFPFLLLACGQNQQSASKSALSPEGQFASPLPTALQKHKGGSLSAEVEVNGRTIVLQVDLDGTGVCGAIGVCGTITDIPEGEQTFILRFKIDTIVVATSNATGMIVEGSGTPTAIVFSSLTYPDYDGDGFTNLAEIEGGFDPRLASSRPPAESPRFSANYVMTEEVGLSPVVGLVSSSNYSIQ